MSEKVIVKGFKGWAGRMMSEARALFLAYKDPRTPWYARAWLALVLGYLASPIDLIPDFIPVIGHLDDLLLVPAGLALAVKMIPREVLDECRAKATDAGDVGKLWTNPSKPILILLCFAVAVITALAVYGLSSHYRSHREAMGSDAAGEIMAADKTTSSSDVIHFDLVCRNNPGQLLYEMLNGDSITVVDSSSWRKVGTIRVAALRERFVRTFRAVIKSKNVARSSGDGFCEQEYLESYAVPERYRRFVTGVTLPDPQVE